MSNSNGQEKTGYNFTPFEVLCKETDYERSYRSAERGERVKYKGRTCILYNNGAVYKAGKWYFTVVLYTNDAQDYVERVSEEAEKFWTPEVPDPEYTSRSEWLDMSDVGIGSTVEVVNYGHRIYKYEGEKIIAVDLVPHIVGMRGVVRKVLNEQGHRKYALDGIPDKSAWYSIDQLKKVR